MQFHLFTNQKEIGKISVLIKEGRLKIESRFLEQFQGAQRGYKQPGMYQYYDGTREKQKEYPS